MKGEPFLDTLGCGTWALGAWSGAPGVSGQHFSNCRELGSHPEGFITPGLLGPIPRVCKFGCGPRIRISSKLEGEAHRAGRAPLWEPQPRAIWMLEASPCAPSVPWPRAGAESDRPLFPPGLPAPRTGRGLGRGRSKDVLEDHRGVLYCPESGSGLRG